MRPIALIKDAEKKERARTRERERQRETDRQTDRQKDIQRKWEKERLEGRSRNRVSVAVFLLD